MKGHGMSEAQKRIGRDLFFYDSTRGGKEDCGLYHGAQGSGSRYDGGGAGKSQRHKRRYGIQILSQMRV